MLGLDNSTETARIQLQAVSSVMHHQFAFSGQLPKRRVKPNSLRTVGPFLQQRKGNTSLPVE